MRTAAAQAARLQLTVQESKPVPLPPGRDGDRLRRRLHAATADLPFDVFVERRGRLVAGEAVGIVDVGEAQITILPKATGGCPPGRFLSDLLWASGVAPRLFPLAGRMATVRDGLPDALARALADDLLARLVQAVPRRYAERQESSPVLRGRIDMTRQATAAPHRAHLLEIRHTPLQTDNPLTQLIRATARTLMRFASSADTRHRLLMCDELLSAAEIRPLDRRAVAAVRLMHTERQWSRTVELAATLAGGDAPATMQAGGTSSLALLFSLNDLFEALLRRRLPGALEGTGLGLLKSPPRPRLLANIRTGRSFLRLKPDYLLGGAAGPCAVADAKWKVLKPSPPSHGLSSSDAYQVGTYMARHGVRRGILLFPKADWMSGRWRTRSAMLGHADSELRMVAVDVAGLVDRDPARVRRAQHILGLMVAAAACARPT